MATIDVDEYRKHMAPLVEEGFTLDPPGYERLSAWTHVLMQLLTARTNFERVRDHPVALGDLASIIQQQAFFIAAIMAYGRCYASSGPGIPSLDPKKVYAGSDDGMAVHRRLMELRNKFAAHTDETDLLRLTLAVKDETNRIIVRHLVTSALPAPEIPDFLEAVAHTQHFVTGALNKRLDHLESKVGKAIALD